MPAVLSSQENSVIRLPNGTRLHLSSSDFLEDAGCIIEEIFQAQVYRHPGFDLRPTDTIMDLGSHVGVFAHWAAPQIPSGRMICVEPTSSADSFEYSLAQNGITNVRLHRCAAGPPSSTLELIEDRRFAGLNRSHQFQPSTFMHLMLAIQNIRQARKQLHICRVPCRSIEEIMTSEKLDQCDLLKMDCEGGEYAILEHTSRHVLRRFKRIMLEFHLFHPGHSLRRIEHCLEECGFSFQVKKKWLHHLLNRTGMIWATRID